MDTAPAHDDPHLLDARAAEERRGLVEVERIHGSIELDRWKRTFFLAGIPVV